MRQREDPDTIYQVKQDGLTHLSYTYDALGRLSTVGSDSFQHHLTTYTYTDVGANQTSTQVRSMTVDGEKQYYYYDDVGNLLYVADANGNPLEAYTYDALGQLTGATIGSDVYAYTYDSNGNILTATKNNVTKNYGYTDSSWSDLLTSYNGYSFTYDNIGNPLNYRDGYTMTWVNGRQLNSVNLGNNQTVGFSYNADGQRLFKNSNSKSVMYLVVDGVAVGESINNGQTTIYYLFDENSSIYGINVDGYDYFFRKNLQGDVVGIWDNEGAQIVTYTYDPWGKLLSVTDTSGTGLGTLNPFRYRSYYYDTETGFYYLQSRYYDPEICRFVNADGQLNNDALGCNLFAYCGNNPVNKSDYNGHEAIAATLLTLGKAFIIGAAACLAYYVFTRPPVKDAIVSTLETIDYGVRKAADWISNGLNDICQSISDSLSKTPKLPEYKSETEDHHIVAQNSYKAEPARKALEKVGIGVNDSENIVTLSTKFHRRLHTNTYYSIVNIAIVGSYYLAGDDQNRRKEYVSNTLYTIKAVLVIWNELIS